ncbi:MAG: FAD-dependent oxidoreductase [Acutalibacteraceae bacterium]|nr:FAD-dependent oxidoreductase [Acutalibacteraceae bacterium]
MQTIWIDAAEFKNKGQWKLESQFVRSVGASYLLGIHKPGVPVEDAHTPFTVEEDGYYRFFVRTKNWKFPEAPGQFTLATDNTELPNVLGKMPTHKWYWEIAGDMYLKKGEHTLTAIDKTGWLARFASVVITNDMDFTPSPEIERFLKQRAEIKGISTKPDELHFDYVIVGAGPAGIPAAIEAARNGLKVALISGRPAIGGNASDEGTIGMEGAASRNRGAWEGGIFGEIRALHMTNGLTYQAAFEKLCAAEKNITVFLDELCIDAESENGHIISATTINTNTLKKTKFYGDYFCDSSGDGWLGYYAGAAYRFGREAKREYNEDFAPEVPDTLTMSGCICGWQEDLPKMRSFKATKTDKKVTFTAPDWAIKLPEGDELYREAVQVHSASWWLENSNDHDDLWDDEFARDEMIRLTLGYFHWLKNSARLKPHLAEVIDYYDLTAIALHNSKRETRRLIGDYVFNQNDCVADRKYPDAISYCGWSIDVHHPRGIYSGKEGAFHSNTTIPVCALPYRILYSKNIDNLFIAGRCCSVSHIGLGTVRVEATLATLGQATGAAVHLCKKYGTTPRGIYENHIKELQQLLLRHDLTIPDVVNEDEKDLARTATVSATSVARDIYYSTTPGTKDIWIPLTTEIYSGPYCDAAKHPAEFYKAELKNLSDEGITVKAKLWQYNQNSDINETIEKIDECEITIEKSCEKLVDLPFTAKSEKANFVVSFEPNKNIAWRRRVHPYASAVVYYSEDGKIAQHPDEAMELYFNSALHYTVDASPENVINGINRPLGDKLNGWASEKGLPASLSLTLKEPKKISQVIITTQVELAYPMYNFYRFTSSVGTATDLTVSVRNGENWTEVAHITDNVFKQMVVRFSPSMAEEVKITINESMHSTTAHITEVRIYE